MTEPTIHESFRQAEAYIDNNKYDDSVIVLKQLQDRIARAALFSENETLADVATSSLALLRVDHLLAVSLTRQSGTDLVDRLSRLQLACDLWENFLERLQQMELLKDSERNEMTKLLEYMEACNSDDNNEVPLLQIPRETKINRLRIQQQVKQERQKLDALHERRRRLGVAEEDVMDGYDDEGIQRDASIKALELSKMEALEELGNTLREIPMLKRMTKDNSTPVDERRPPPPAQSLPSS